MQNITFVQLKNIIMQYLKTIFCQKIFRFLLVALSLLLFTNIYSQHYCGTETSNKEISQNDIHYSYSNKQSWKNKRSQFTIKLNINILQGSNSDSPELTIEKINYAVNELNQYFSPIGIYFATCEAPTIHHVNRSLIDSTVVQELVKPSDKFGYINIYFADYIIHDTSGSVCGYAYYPREYSPLQDIKCRVLIDNQCFGNKILAHEFGHLFGLMHTHGSSNKYTTGEWVNGCNCKNEGDYICDTPADPNLSNKVANCKYTGDEIDDFGDIYKPSVGNIMSYSNCKNEFTSKQYERMLDNFHYYWKGILAVNLFNEKDSLRSTIPTYVHIDDSPILLNNYEYIINGPGVEQNFFDPKKAGVGNHTLNYDISENIVVSNFIIPEFIEEIYPEDTLWQSFKTNHTGYLNGLQLAIYPISNKEKNINFELSLYEGKGIKGKFLHQENISLPSIVIEDPYEYSMYSYIFKDHLSHFADIPLPMLFADKNKLYTMQIKSSDSYYAGFQYNRVKNNDTVPTFSSFGYENSLNTFSYQSADTIYNRDTTYYWPSDTIIREERTYIWYPNLTGIDSSCFSLLVDTTFWPSDTILPFSDTIQYEADTIYREATTIIKEQPIGFSTFITLNDQNDCWSNFVKEVQVYDDYVKVLLNPAKYNLNIFFINDDNLTPLAIEVYSLDGKRLYRESISSFSSLHSIPVNNFEKGLYLVSVIYEEEVFSQKFLKN